MKNGFKIFDTDTHVRPSLETLEPYYDANVRASLPELEPHKRENRRDVEGMVVGRHSYSLGERVAYSRLLGKAEPEPGHFAPRSKYMGTRHATKGAIDDDAGARLLDMDEEGVDVQFLIGGAANTHSLNNHELNVGFMRAYNRYLHDFCGKAPHRLKAAPPVALDAVDECVKEIRRWGKEPWMVGILPQSRNDIPLDHPVMGERFSRALGCSSLGRDAGDRIVHRLRHHGALQIAPLRHPRERLRLAAVLESKT
jgi:hypothetical protein